MEQILGRGETPHVMRFPSAVVRLCMVAAETGLDLRRAVFTSAGEPRVERQPPLPGPSGKIQHLHVGERRSRP
jgi:hypothetical protein